MIKIQIPDVAALKQDYLGLVEPLILKRLKLVKLSLEHLQDPQTIRIDDIVSVKTITKEIVNKIRKPSLPFGNFSKKVYKTGVENYLIGATTIKEVNLASLSELIDFLIDPTSVSLEKLLVGNPEDLKKTSVQLLKKYELGNTQELEIIKIAFDYEGKIGKEVRNFFYNRSLTTFCPYCNQGLALHTENEETGKTADQFHLDHFFDKVNNPLLAISLFNLVPSDTTCNVTNKHTTPFSDKYHLNPYISGFKRDMVFKPILDPLDREITKIELSITVPRNSPRHLQLIGDSDKIHEQAEHGNLNVFQIYSKYNRKDVLERTSKILNNLYKAAINKRSLECILNEVGMANSYENFKKWYEGTVYTQFHENEFDKQAYSKLNRDILDFVYSRFPEEFNEEVHEILSESYLITRGGE